MLWDRKKTARDRAPAEKTENVYLSAREEWLERYGSYIKRSAQWRMTAWCAIGIALLSLSANIMQLTQAKVVPYIIAINEIGQWSAVARADHVTTSPQRAIQADIAACISDWRTVTADNELQKKMIRRLSHYFVGAAKGVLAEWYNHNNPYEIAKQGRLVQVNVQSLPLPVSPDSWRVEWTETVRNHAGILLSQSRFAAMVRVQLDPPTTEEQLLNNPSGLHIIEISTTRIMD